MAETSLVVTDLDGTLWDGHERLHEDTRAALVELERREVPLLVATGRRSRSAAAGLGRAGLAPPIVSLDGAIGRAEPGGARFHERSFTADDAHAVLGAFDRVGLSPCVYIEQADVDVVVGDRPSTHPAHLEFIGDGLKHADLATTVARYAVYAFGVVGAELERIAAMPMYLDHAGEASIVMDRQRGGAAMMVRARGISKWTGVVAWCERLGLDHGRVLAVGDDDNDVEMLDAAQVACVTSDGSEAALACADHVIGPAAQGGWSAVLDLVR